MAAPTALVVDDDAQIRVLFAFLLARAGFEVDAAASGYAALEKIRTKRPDVLTLDLKMGDLGGAAVLERLREMPDPPAVVLVSGSPRPPDAELGAPVVAFIKKPVRPASFVETCTAALAARPA
jgi:two-component system KDP operon response regulator KdpE